MVINWPLFSQLDSFFGGLDNGVNLVVHGRKPVSLPNLSVIGRIIDLSWPVLLMAFVGIVLLMKHFRRGCHTGWVLLSALVLFTGILFLTPVMPIRYILIPAVTLYALAGLGIVMLAELSARNQKTENQLRIKVAAAFAAVVLFLFAAPVYRSMAIDAFYQGDTRAELTTWINSTLDDDVVLAGSRKIRLPGVNGYEPVIPNIRIDRDWVTFSNRAEINPSALEEMRQNGITHIIIHEGEWKQYLKRAQAKIKSTDLALGTMNMKPEVVWRVPDRYKEKNRWLRSKMVVVQL